MNESGSNVEGGNPVLTAPSPESAGAMLRTAREKAGLHIAALAVAIKIPVKKLEALEADQLHGTHDLVFTRALASSVCRTLKIDAKPILDALPQTVVRELHVDDNGINAPFAASSVGHTRPMSEALVQPRVLLVLALCFGAFLIFVSGWWGGKESGSSAGVTAADEAIATPQAMAPVVIPAAPTSEPTSEVVVSTSLPASSATVPESALVVATTAKSSSAPAATPVRGESTPLGTSLPAVPGSELILSFKAKHQAVWVEVVDAKGEVRLRRNVGAGERVECGGVLPLAVVIGRADSVDVEVRGRPFNFSPFAKENVARFEVK